jgi:signal transduction histidine kinase
LLSDTVYAVLTEPDGTLWAGIQGGGLARVRDGQIRSVTAQQGIHLDTIGQLLDDGEGRLWMAGLGGLVRAEKTALNRCADGTVKSIRTILLELKDGFTQTDFVYGHQPAAVDTGDGRLWFTAGRGLGTVQPALVDQRLNLAPPPVVIKGVIADDQAIPVPALGPSQLLRLEPGTRRLEIRYNALSYAAPRRVRFQYRLLGVDEDWVDAGADRAVRYARLPPGEYVFQARACNNDGVWNYEGASLAFYLAPFFRQTVWFRLLVAALSAVLVASAAYSVARARHRRRIALARQREALERERGRIARDMHDEVGAQLTRIAILSRLAQGNPDVQGELADLLHNVTQTSKDCVNRFDEIVWAVNPRNDTLRHFADYLANYAMAYFEQTEIQCVLNMPSSLPDAPLSTTQRHNLVRACEEALGNALRHAQATRVDLTLAVERGRVMISVSDDGKGFTEPATEVQGNGLYNMRKRLSDIGGECEIRSVPGRGTTIQLHIALRGVHNHA